MDLLDEVEWHNRVQHTLSTLDWRAPWYSVSSITGQGLPQLCDDIMTRIETATLADEQTPDTVSDFNGEH